MKTLVAYSSKTGNTKMVAEAINEVLNGELLDVRKKDSVNLDDYNKIVIGFWVDKGGPDPLALEFMKIVKDKEVGLFFTLGAYPDSDHAEDVMNKSTAMMEENGNKVVAKFRCMGKIDPALTARFKKLGEDSPHKMDEARMKRHEEAAKHPNQEDFDNAKKAFECMI
ncbi:MAG: flavodoxin family protein [Tissierellia bacterium]|nr:flavodoxin family protein [Tissierellia bacterium]